jgi:hypothetical protein
VPPNWIAQQPVIAPLTVAIDLCEWTLGVEPLVTDEFEQVAMHHVGARLGHRAHRRTGVDPVLGGQAASGHAEFLQRVGKGKGRFKLLLTSLCMAPSSR